MRWWALLLVLPALSGCYLLQAASGQAAVAARSEPIERVMADPDTPEATRARLELAQQVRAYAVDELGLPDGRSFRSYADLGRPYAVWNVVATAEFSVEPLRWCFPVAGCVAYRGYFAEADARAEAARLAAILPSPRRYQAADPGPYVRRRASRIQAAMGTVREAGLDRCVDR